MQAVSANDLAGQLVDVGVPAGAVLVVHTAFSHTGPVEGGPRGLIEALQHVLGPYGTLVMPSMSDDDDHPFDAHRTPCAGMGVVADMFRRMPAVRRSDSPHAFAASGRLAGLITRPHPLDIPHGTNSPIGRVHAHDGWVLLLGVGHDADTTIHLAENLAGVSYRRHKYLTVAERGRSVRVEYDEIDHCCEKFALLDDWLDAAGHQRRGLVGHGEARLVRARDVVAAAVAKLRENETVFLHAPGVCTECDDARSAIDDARPGGA